MGGCIRKVTLYINNTFRNYQVSWFKQATSLHSDPIRQVLPYIIMYQQHKDSQTHTHTYKHTQHKNTT